MCAGKERSPGNRAPVYYSVRQRGGETESRLERSNMRIRANTLAVLGAVMVAAPMLLQALPGQSAAPGVDPAKLPARDEHQGLLIAADPYLSAERSAAKFGKKHPYGAGLLAVDVYLRNATDSPIQVVLPPIELNVSPPGGKRQRLEALSAQDAAIIIIHPALSPTTKRLPIPGAAGGSIKQEKDVVKLQAALAPQMLGDIVDAHSTVHGFLFFDVGAQFDLVSHSSVYFPQVRRVNPDAGLFFFEVDLGPAVK